MCWRAWCVFTALVRVEHVVLLRSLSSVPPIYIGHFQISSFLHVFYPLSLFLSAGWPCDLCRDDKTMPWSYQLKTRTPHTYHTAPGSVSQHACSGRVPTTKNNNSQESPQCRGEWASVCVRACLVCNLSDIGIAFQCEPL